MLDPNLDQCFTHILKFTKDAVYCQGTVVLGKNEQPFYVLSEGRKIESRRKLEAIYSP